MKTRNIMLIGFVMIIFIAAVLSLLPGESAGKTIIVDEGGNGDYLSISDAIDAAEEGDTIRIYDGLYQESGMIVDKGILLIGNGSTTTSIDGGGVGSVVTVTADNVTIRGFGIRNSGNIPGDSGIMLLSDGNTIQDNVMSENRNGIYPKESSNNIISNNICVNNTLHGITMGYSGSMNNTIEINTLSENEESGVYLGLGSGNILSGNTMEQNEWFGIFCNSSWDIGIFNNSLSGNERSGLWVKDSNMTTISGNIIEENDEYGIHLESVTDITISGNMLSRNNEGIRIQGTANGSGIHDNQIYDNTHYGIFRETSSGEVLSVVNNWWGDRSGPYHPSLNPNGKGNNVSGPVDFVPWLKFFDTPGPKSIWYVDDDAEEGGAGSFAFPLGSIADGIMYAANGNRIILREGTYYENIVLNKTLELRGDPEGEKGIEGVILDGGDVGDVITVTPEGEGSKIADITVTHSNLTIPSSSGILVNAPCVIENVRILETRNGILVKTDPMYQDMSQYHGKPLVQIRNCILLDNSWGVNLHENSSAVVENSRFENNNLSIHLYFSNGNTVMDNVLTGNYLGIWSRGSSNSTIRDNSCSFSRLNGFVFSNSHNTTISGNELYMNNVSGIQMDNSYNNSLLFNNCSENIGSGIILDTNRDIILKGNDLSNNVDYGFFSEYSSNITFSGGIVSSNNIGIGLVNVTDIIVESSICSTNNNTGLLVNGSSGVVLKENYFSDNSMGIRVEGGSVNTTILNNVIVASRDFGLYAENNTGIVVNASKNFWGDLFGPYHPVANPKGEGDRVSDMVLFDPWVDVGGNVVYLKDVTEQVGGEDDGWPGDERSLMMGLIMILAMLVLMLVTIVASIFGISPIERELHEPRPRDIYRDLRRR